METRFETTVDRGALKSLTAVAAREKMYYALNKIYLTRGAIVASDGKAIAVLPVETTVTGDGAGKLLTRESMLYVVKLGSRKVPDISMTVNCSIRAQASGIRQYSESAGGPERVFSGPSVEAAAYDDGDAGVYPDWRAVMPKPADVEGRLAITIDAALLARVAAAVDGESLVTLYVSMGDYAGIAVAGSRGVGVVMPVDPDAARAFTVPSAPSAE